ncbi:MAG: hypothetical protein ABSA04_08860, partial [Desulfobaccales bacterium]
LRLPWRPSPHHLVIIPLFCHLPVLLGHVLSPNPVSKKTGSTSAEDLGNFYLLFAGQYGLHSQLTDMACFCIGT